MSKYTGCADSVDIANIIKKMKYSEKRKEEVLCRLHRLNKGYVSTYTGKPIIIKPDEEIEEIVLPQSLIPLLKQLEVNINEN